MRSASRAASATSWETQASPNGSSSTLQHKIAWGTAALALLLAFTVFRPPSTPGPLERDFEAYYAAGRTVDAGGDPYSREIWTTEARIPGVNATHDEFLPFVGPPAALPFWALLARLPYSAALGAWTAVLIAAFITVIGCALRLAGAARNPLLAAGAAVFSFAAAPAISDFALGQAALLSAAAIAAAIVAFRARNGTAAFTATLLAAVQPNLALALIGRIRSRWDLAVASLAAATFAGMTFAAGGATGGRRYLDRLAAHGNAERFTTIQHTPAAIAFAFGLTPPAASGVGIALALVAALVTIFVVIRERLDPTAATLVTCAALPLAVPFFHEHDFVLELLPVLVLALGAVGRARIYAGIAAVLILVDWLGLAQRHLAQGQIVCLGFAVSAAFAGLAPPGTSRWGQLGAAGALVALATVAIPLGLAHPAPTWPDMLPAAFHAGAGTDASALWGAEQRAAGLIAPNAVWGALRAIPLAGCILLAIAIVADARERERAA